MAWYDKMFNQDSVLNLRTCLILSWKAEGSISRLCVQTTPLLSGRSMSSDCVEKTLKALEAEASAFFELKPSFVSYSDNIMASAPASTYLLLLKYTVIYKTGPMFFIHSNELNYTHTSWSSSTLSQNGFYIALFLKLWAVGRSVTEFLPVQSLASASPNPLI